MLSEAGGPPRDRPKARFSTSRYDKEVETRLTLPTEATLPSGLVPHVFAGSYVNGTGNRETIVRVRCAQKNEHTVLSVAARGQPSGRRPPAPSTAQRDRQ